MLNLKSVEVIRFILYKIYNFKFAIEYNQELEKHHREEKKTEKKEFLCYETNSGCSAKPFKKRKERDDHE